MKHKCFISYKKEDQYYRDKLVELFDSADVIDKSLNRFIESDDGEYIMSVIRRDYLKDSTVTLFLIGSHSSDNEGNDWYGRPRNYFIQRELQASLYNGPRNTRNGILGIVLPNMYDEVYDGTNQCDVCGGTHRIVNINDDTVIREFSSNYYIKPHEGCAWSEDERYCTLVKWSDFLSKPEKYIDFAYDKRTAEISNMVKIRNLR